jgi:hypothetical protein
MATMIISASIDAGTLADNYSYYGRSKTWEFFGYGLAGGVGFMTILLILLSVFKVEF